MQVIEIDSGFAGGYAGKSIALSMKVIFIKSDAPSRDLDSALKSFEMNLAQSGPSGPHMDVFLAMTYLRMNKSLEAQAIMEKILRTDPDYPIGRWLNNFIKSEEEVRETVDQLLVLAR